MTRRDDDPGFKVRLAAWEVMRYGGTAPLRELNRIAAQHELEDRDRALLRNLVATTYRRLGTLRALVDQFAQRKPKPEVATALHLGLAQLFFLDRVPDHAAVSSTVDATNAVLDIARGRFVNAVLRSAIRARREGHCGDPRRDIPLTNWHLDEPFMRDPQGANPLLWVTDALSIPSSLAKAWANRFGDETMRRLATDALREPPLSVQVLDEDLESVLIELQTDDLEPLAVGGHSLLFAPEATGAIVASDLFQRGAITIQGATAARAAALVGAAEGERILDLCAAPGGKTAVMAAAGAHVVACDVDESKLERLASTVARFGLTERVELCLTDGTSSLGESGFDAVLIDAPCSNTGVLAARPEARWRYGPKTMRDLRELQARLLREGAERVRPGGRLVWSTCSLEPSENVGQVKGFLSERKDWQLEESFESLPDLTDGPADGGWAARLRHSG
ncbi:transcription antitermination factor NusB [Engelhardtia mirabilis]|uniref:Ribosomal RNA small subunit methyltransferase B n=1 Tax=Engelhardtia mirabilis TaxID=2528011 RepID=A0A518BDA1_9BACT|nr:Ribosomal RNA small subunit methyltransferase B [Planctomycetes bacterium Pla133]QDU99280.1 Ribosomal RNA small subunit methyltransferase B [Planctomycetes bacterium Pla86]